MSGFAAVVAATTSRQTRPKGVLFVDIIVKAVAKSASSNLHAWTTVDLFAVADLLSTASRSRRGNTHSTAAFLSPVVVLRHWRWR